VPLAEHDNLEGHLRSNGPLGWIVLGRAYETLLILERGWLTPPSRGRRRSDQSLAEGLVTAGGLGIRLVRRIGCG
jgi:hypothetical protein